LPKESPMRIKTSIKAGGVIIGGGTLAGGDP
jgi:hypothetical protein